jgi:hypothetical protein
MLRQGSGFAPCRRCLLLHQRPSSGTAFAGDAVAQRRFQGLVKEVPLAAVALLPLHTHRIARSCSLAVEFGPSSLVRTTTASADFSRSIGRRCRRPAPNRRRDREISQGKTLLLRSVVAGFTSARVRLTFGPLRPLPDYPTAPAFDPVLLFVNAELCLQLPPHPASRRRSCLRLSVPVSRPEKDLHLQDQHHAWHTKRSPARGRGACPWQAWRSPPQRKLKDRRAAAAVRRQGGGDCGSRPA